MKQVSKNAKHFCLIIMLLAASFIVKAGNFYWVGGSGSWSDFTNHWATTSGGATFQVSVPGANDDVYFDGNSFTAANQFVNATDIAINFRNMDWTGATFNPEFQQLSVNSVINIYGSVKLISAMNWNISGSLLFLSNSTGNTITSAGRIFKNRVEFQGSGGSWVLQDALTLNGAASATNSGLITLNFGTLNTNGYAVTALGFLSSNSNLRTLIIDNSVITLNNTGSFIAWNTSSVSNFTLSTAGSSIIIAGTNSYPEFYSISKTFNNLSFTNTSVVNATLQGGSNIFAGNVIFSGITTLNGNHTFNGNLSFLNNASIRAANTINGTLTFTPGKTYTLQAGNTQTISATGNLSANGSCVLPITIQSSTNGSQATISKMNGNLDVDQVVLRDMNATLSATYTANATNSFDAGNNTNWIFPPLNGAAMYWIGGSGNWNDPAHWSLSSGGVASTCIPGPGNDVFFDANSSFIATSRTVTVNVGNASCKSMSWTGAANTPTFASNGSSAGLSIYGSLTLIPNMTLSYMGKLSFEAQTGGNNIISAGKNWPMNYYEAPVNFNGIGGTWTFQDAFSTNSDIFLNNGTLNTNSLPVTSYGFNSQNNTIRTLNMGTSTWICTGHTGWSVSTSNNLTLNTGTSTIRSTYPYLNFSGGGKTYYNLKSEGVGQSPSNIYTDNTFNGTVTFLGDVNINQSNTFNGNLIFSPGGKYILASGSTQTIGASGSLIANGTCNTGFITISSSNAGSQATINKIGGDLVVDNTRLQDSKALVAIGYQANALNSSIDAGGNSNWNFTTGTGKSLYWVGGTGNWTDVAHWALSSGGAGGNCIPGPNDDVFFDANSFTNTSKTVSLNTQNANCRNMNWTGALFSPTFNNIVSGNMNIYGSLTLISAMNYSLNTPVFFLSNTTGNTIITAGKTINSNISFNGPGGSWTLLDGFTMNFYGTMNLEAGTLNTNNQTVNVGYFYSYTGRPRALNLGSSIFNINYIYWYVTAYNFSLNAGTSTIRYTNPYTGYPFYGGGLTYNNLVFETGSNGSIGVIGGNGNNIFNGTVTFNSDGQIDGSQTFNGNVIFNKNGFITGSNTYNRQLKFTLGNQYTLTSGATQTFSNTGTLNAVGSNCFKIGISSSINGTASTLFKASGEVCADGLALNGIRATGGAIFSGGLNSVNANPSVGTGWVFTACSTQLQSAIITASGSLCGAGNITLTARSSSTYLWSPGGATTQSIVVAAAGTYSVYIRQTAVVNGNTSLVCDENGFYVVTAGNFPTCSITGASATCPGSSETYTAPADMASYEWTISGNGSIPGSAIGQSVIVVPTGCGSYTLTLNISNASGCSSTCSTTVTVTDVTVPVITCPPNITTSNATGLCGKNVSFTVSATDNCGTPIVVSTPASGSFFNVGTTSVTSVATDACGNQSSCSFTVTVTADLAIILTSASGTNAQTACINAAITNITYSTTGIAGANGATFSGLPLGVTGSLAGNGNITISGTPTATGTFNYTINLTGCSGTLSESGSITVNPANTINLNPESGSDQQTVCANTEISNITYSTSGATGATFTGLPAGVTGIWSANEVLISGTPTAAGTFTYTVTLTGGCGSITATGTIMVNAAPTISISPANPSICNGSSITLTGSNSISNTLTYNISLANLLNLNSNCDGIEQSYYNGCNNSPAGFTWSDIGNGTVTNVQIQFGVGVECAPALHGTTLNSVSGNSFQTFFQCSCSGQSLDGNNNFTLNFANPTYNVGGANSFLVQDIISCFGLIKTAALNNYFAIVTVTYNGSGGSVAGWLWTPGGETTAAITVNPNTNTSYTLTGISPQGCSSSVSKTVVVNPLPAIYNVTGGGAYCADGTGISVGLDGSETGVDYQLRIDATNAGSPVTGTGNAISFGDQTIAGNYTVVATNAATTCSNNMSGAVDVSITPNNTITLTSEANTNSQTVCINTAITDITYSTNGATGANFAGLPAGVSGVWANNAVTISGSPTVSGSFSYTVTLTGGCGAISANGTITVNSFPTINCPANISVNSTSGQCGANVSYPVAATVTGTPIPVISYSPVSGSFFSVGLTTVTVTASNTCGTATCTFTVTVNDDQVPVITCPVPAASYNTDEGVCTSSQSFSATATDNCGEPSIVYTVGGNVISFPYAFPVGSTTVTATATDASELSSTCTFDVVVVDNQLPVINCPANINVYASSAAGAVVTYTTPVGTDNCTATTTRTAGLASGENFPIGVTIVTYVVTDASGNTTQCSFTVTVAGLAPQIICPANINVNNTPGQCGTIVTFIATETTAIPASVITYSHQPGSFFPVGTTIVTATATNAVGVSTCTFNIVVVDSERPTIVCPSNKTVNCQDDKSPVANGTATASDNCTVPANIAISFTDASTQNINPANAGYYNYIISRTWKATDAANNFSECTQTITVQDVTAPVVTCPVNVTVNCQDNKTSTSTGVATGTDNCSPVTVTQTQTSTQDANVNNAAHYNYVITRTWNATDVTGNASSCVQLITVHDVTAPVISCPANVTVNCQANNTSTATGVATATDNCSPVTITQSQTSTQSSNPNAAGYYNYVITRTWRATDVTGNFSECVQTITVQDVSNPVITCPVSVNAIRSTNAGLCTYKVQGTEFNATATDNCSVQSLEYTLSGATTGTGTSLKDLLINRGTTTVTWTATDGVGHQVSCSFTILVNDDQNTTDYMIYAQKEAKFGEYHYIGGDVGVTASNGKADFKKYDVLDPYKVQAANISFDMPSNVSTRIYSPATGGPAPTFYPYNGTTTGLSNIDVTVNNTTLNGNYKNVKVKSGITATVTGNNFGKITIEEGAKVTFTAAVINLTELSVKKGKKNDNIITVVNFTNPASVQVKDKVTIEDDSRVNVNGPKVTFYTGDNTGGDEKFAVRGENIQVTANIIIPEGKLSVDGGNDLTRPTMMTGWYIIEKLDGNGKYVYWKKYNCGTNANPSFSRVEEPAITTQVPVMLPFTVPATQKFEVKLYPNPTPGDFNIQVITGSSEQIMVKIMNVNGAVIQASTKLTKQGLIALANKLPGGTYFVEVTQGKNREVVKLIRLN